MERQNPFYRRSRISTEKFRQLVRYFAMDMTATDTAELTKLTRKTVNQIYLKTRRRLAEQCERESPLEGGEVEVDESYLGARRERGRGAAGKTIVFGLRETRRQGVHRDCARLQKGHLASDYSRTSRARNRDSQRWLARL